jgi:glycosyltransferase involved in cell wall biosynthesis
MTSSREVKTISVVTPCFNEEGNVREVYERVRALMLKLGRYRYEHIFIDNASRDSTFAVLSEIASADPNVKVIRNARNFGHLRSPMHAMFQACGDAVICLMSDLQDPPEVLAELLEQWENGYSIVIAVKNKSREAAPMFLVRKLFYRLVNHLADDIETYENFTGFGLYDRKVIELVRQFGDAYPYFRGMIAEIGLPHAEVFYEQQRRKSGKTKNNFYTLYDLAMLGITKLSRVPLRLVTFAGFFGAIVSMLGGTVYFGYKLLYWRQFTVGIAPIAIGMFFLGSLQLLFMGILGEYVGNIHTQVHNRPLVVERERFNFQYEPGEPSPRSAPASVAAAGH